MHRIAVSSSNIRSIGYERTSQTLEIEFHGGGIYQYFSVPESTFQGLMNASSHGKYLHAYIKHAFPYQRIC
jgi:hypothetical protein